MGVSRPTFTPAPRRVAFAMFADDQRASPTPIARRSFSNPTLASAEKVRAKSPAASKSERELKIPRSPSARSLSDASTRANQRSSPSTARKTIASFLAEARADATSPSSPAATSPSGRRWSAPLPPPSPGTPSVFGRGAPASPSADLRTLGGNPLTAVNAAADLGVGYLPSAAARGYSGAVFGNLFRREEAASVVKFREMAVMRERIRADAVRGAGTDDDAARAEIARLQAQVDALVVDIERFRGEEKNARAHADRSASRETDDEEPSADAEGHHPVGDENVNPADASRRVPDANHRASSARSLLREVLRDAAAAAAGTGTGTGTAMGTGTASDRSRSARGEEHYASSDAEIDRRRDASDLSAAPTRPTSRPTSRPNSRVAFSSPARSERSDHSGRYLRTTRRDIEEARYRRGLSPHSGGAPREFWGEGRGAVQGGASIGTEGAEGAEGADWRGSRTRSRDARDAAYEAGAAAVLEAAVAALAGERDRDRGTPTAAQIERERAAEETGRLREANRHLRRELGVAQRLMTGYHAQLMTGGVGARGLLPPPRARGRGHAAPSYRERRAHPPFAHPFPPRDEFSFRVDGLGPVDARVDEDLDLDFDVGPSASAASPGAPTHSAHRAQSKRRAAELATLRAERAFAEAAVAADGLETIRLAEEVRELKAIVAGLVRRATLAAERRRDDDDDDAEADAEEETVAAEDAATAEEERFAAGASSTKRTPGSRGDGTPASVRETPASAVSASASAGASLLRTPTPASVAVPSARLSPSPAPAMDVSLATDAEAFFEGAGDADTSVRVVGSASVPRHDDETAEVGDMW